MQFLQRLVVDRRRPATFTPEDVRTVLGFQPGLEARRPDFVLDPAPGLDGFGAAVIRVDPEILLYSTDRRLVVADVNALDPLSN